MKYNTALPFFEKDDIQYVLDEFRKLLEGNGLLSMGEHVRAFEKQFAQYIGARYAIATSSGTGALETVMRAMNIGAGDEVIVPVQTFIATASSVARVGATPVFAEIDDKFLLDIEKIEQFVTENTKAVIVVHFAGLIHEKIFEMREWLNSREIALIEDAAHAHGASINGVKAGALGDAATFSFYSSKNITTGEGGMITTDNRGLADRCASIRARGLDVHAGYDIFTELGTNQRMTEVQALMGLVQLNRLEEFVNYRNALANIYRKVLEPAITTGLIEIPIIPEHVRHAYWRFVVFLKKGQDRELIAKKMVEHSIKIDWPYQPLLHLQPIMVELYKNSEGLLPFTEKLAKTHICIPIHRGISINDSVYIADKLLESLYRFHRRPIGRKAVGK